MFSFFGEWLDGNPIAILGIVIIILALAGRSLVTNQGKLITPLVQAVIDLTKNIDQLATDVAKLEELYRNQIENLIQSSATQEENQGVMLTRIDAIELKLNGHMEPKETE